MLALPSREPDYKVTASIRKDGKVVARMPSQIWVPQHLHERAVVQFSSRNRAHSALLRNPYDFEARLDSFAKKRQEVIRGRGLWLEGPSTRYFSGNEQPVVTASAQPALLTTIHYLDSVRDPNRRTVVSLGITPNRLLEPHQTIIHSYTGSSRVRTHKTLCVSVPQLGKVCFRKRYYTIGRREVDEGITTFENLVAEFEVEAPAITIPTQDGRLRAAIEPLLLLASLLTMQRTVVLAWHAHDQAHVVSSYVGDIVRPRSVRPNVMDYLVEPSESAKFLKTSIKTFNRLDSDARELVIQSIHKLLVVDEPIETRFLSLFSALEGMVLLVRRTADLEHTISSSSAWKGFEQRLRTLILNEAAITDDVKRKMIIGMLPALRRVPLKNAFEAFCRIYGLDVSDLWPVFDGSEVPLSGVRNRLVHGATVPRNGIGALVYANRNLEVLVQRMIVAVLGWPLKRTRLCAGALASWGITNDQLAKSIAAFRSDGDAARANVP